MKTRILVFEYDKFLASAIRELLELENYVALDTAEPDAAMLALDSFCPTIIVLGYYRPLTNSYKRFLERCQLNYPIAYLCSFRFEQQIRDSHFFDTQDRIIIKPFAAEDMLRSLLSMQSISKD